MLGAATCGAWWRRVVGFYLGGGQSCRFELDRAVGRDHLGDGELERLYAFASDGRDGVERKLAALRHGGEFFEFGGIGNVRFSGNEDGRLGSQGWVEGCEFGGDDLVISNGVRPFAGVGDVYKVDDDAGAFDVA